MTAPRIAALAFDGWDTHANEGGAVGRLAQLLSGLDGALAEFESGLAARWRDTVGVGATEFGRTASINGTAGTDHGTGTIALLAGGAVQGGRVISDWPGLKPSSLYEGRDLAPTTDLRAVIKGVLHDHLGVSERVLAAAVFPDSAGVTTARGVVWPPDPTPPVIPGRAKREPGIHNHHREYGFRACAKRRIPE